MAARTEPSSGPGLNRVSAPGLVDATGSAAGKKHILCNTIWVDSNQNMSRSPPFLGFCGYHYISIYGLPLY